MTNIKTNDFDAQVNAINLFNTDDALGYATDLALQLADDYTVTFVTNSVDELVNHIKALDIDVPDFKLIVSENQYGLTDLNDLDENIIIITDDIRNLHSGKYKDAYPRRNSNTLKHVSEVCVKRSQTVIGWYPLVDIANKKATAARISFAAVVYNENGEAVTEKAGPTVLSITDLLK